MRRIKGPRLTTFQAGLIAVVVIAICTFLGVTKDIPFTKPFEVSAVFKNAPPIHKNMDVRIAGVSIGKVSKVQAVLMALPSKSPTSLHTDCLTRC